MPFIVVEVCGDYARFPAVALAHEFKEGVYLFGVEGEVPELVDDQQVVPGESVDELICRAVGKGAVELIKKVLSVVMPFFFEGFDLPIDSAAKRIKAPGLSPDALKWRQPALRHAAGWRAPTGPPPAMRSSTRVRLSAPP